jgi:hypothetical protein
MLSRYVLNIAECARSKARAERRQGMNAERYQAGKRDGYEDGKAGRPWPADGAPGSSYSAGYRDGRQAAAIESTQLVTV